ncbi:MAG: anthranilate phosphoribosyltransferase [Aquificae bacterium]|nr:anthranilate phosphoribosyltransferase [Aquificota bacterium]
MEKFLKTVGVGVHGSKALSFEEAEEAMRIILNGDCDDIETGAFFMAMRYKGEEIQELKGFLEALRDETKITHTPKFKPLDISVPYDGKNRTPHILPASIFIATSSGLKITGHGSENVPAKYGTNYYDVLIEMGCCYLKDKEDVLDALEISGFAYLPQWCFNRKLFALLPKRRKFHLRTFINVIEKLLNPFNTKKIAVGIFHKPYFKKLKELLTHLQFEDFYVIKGVEGGIETNPFKPTTIIDKEGKEIKISPSKPINIEEKSISLKENAKLCYQILKGESHPLEQWAVETAGLLLFIGGVASSIEEGIELAKENLKTKKAYKTFENFQKITVHSSDKIRFSYKPLR